ncbi:unnamed protein product [Effrenium voratum]|nr:unnamed protein product [Effrenium voratum]
MDFKATSEELLVADFGHVTLHSLGRKVDIELSEVDLRSAGKAMTPASLLQDGEGRPTRLGVTAQLRQQPSHLEATLRPASLQLSFQRCDLTRLRRRQTSWAGLRMEERPWYMKPWTFNSQGLDFHDQSTHDSPDGPITSPGARGRCWVSGLGIMTGHFQEWYERSAAT